jgi:hypothetical protein
MLGNGGACTVFQAKTAGAADVVIGNRDFAPAAEPSRQYVSSVNFLPDLCRYQMSAVSKIVYSFGREG